MNAKECCLVISLLVATLSFSVKAQGAEFNSRPIPRQNTSAPEIATISVTDQRGNALSNVKVAESVFKREYTTDDNGRFTCDLSDETRYFYAVDKQRKLANCGRLNPGRRQLQLRLESARVVSGQVVDTDGKPVPGTIVEALPMGPCALSDNEGKFVIGWLPSWEPRNGICLMARNIERNLAVIVDISRQTESIEIALASALTLTGTVTNPAGVPFSGARVTALSLRKWTWGYFMPQRIYTDDKGRFEFSILPQLQEYELAIHADNYLDERYTTGLINTMKETEEIAPIVLHQKQDTANGIEYGRLFVNVVDENSKPIDITEVQMWNAKDHFRADKKSFVVTSKDKPMFYRIEEIPTGYYHVISINEDGYAPFQQTDVLIEKDSTNTINCILSRGGTIEGLVVNEQGKPVEGMPVLIKSPLYCRMDVITDEDGRFYADCMPDMRYSVVAEPESESPYETTVFRGDVLCGRKDIKIVIQNKKGTRLGTSLIGKNLPGFESIEINLDTSQTKDKQMLICFFDMQQRPSRRCTSQLNEQIKQLSDKGVTVIGIQASKVDDKALNEWVKSSGVSFPVGTIEGDPSATLGTSIEEVQFKWGVKSLPWLILTDKSHTVIAEGFTISELDEKLPKATGAENTTEGDKPISANPSNRTMEPEPLKSFLDAQNIFDKWEANYGHIGSMKFRAFQKLIHSENAKFNYVRFSHFEKIIDGERFYVRETTSKDGFEDKESIMIKSFDGDTGKRYTAKLKTGEVGRGLLGASPESGYPVTEYLNLDVMEVTPQMASAWWGDSDNEMMGIFEEKFPEGVPRFAFEFIAGDKAGEVKVLAELEIVAGRTCHVLEISLFPDVKVKYWFAHELGMLMLKYVQSYEGGYVKKEVQEVTSIETDAGRFWYPAEMTREIKNRDEVTKYQLSIYEFVPHIKPHPETFDIDFPEGTKVHHRPTTNPDGSVSWLGNRLTNISGLVLDHLLEQARGKMVLVCFVEAVTEFPFEFE